MNILATREIPVLPDIVANAGGVVASMEEYARSLSGTKVSREQMFAHIREQLGEALGQTLRSASTTRCGGDG
jgi:glutamate dehydrogenase/leucine dehydrogenase